MTKTILVIEDDSSVAGLLEDVLRNEGFTVIVERDGEWGLRTCEAKTPDLVLMDVLLPKVQGFDLIPRIRMLDHGADLPIIVFSGVFRGATYREQMTRRYDIKAYFDKPLDIDRLLDVLHDVFSSAYPAPQRSQGNLPSSITRAERPRPTVADITEEFEIPAKGDLADIPFARLLGLCFRGRVTGALMMRKTSVKKIVYFKEGVPVFVRSNLLSECLGRVMVDERLITQKECERSLEKKRREPGRRQGEILVEMGSISQHNLQFALELQMQMKLFEIFSWQDGAFQLNPATDYEGPQVALSMGPTALIHEGASRTMSAARIRRDLQAVSDQPLLPSSDPTFRYQALQLDPRADRLLDLMDGSRNAETLLDADVIEPQDGALVVYALVCTGLLRAPGPPPAFPIPLDAADVESLRTDEIDAVAALEEVDAALAARHPARSATKAGQARARAIAAATRKQPGDPEPIMTDHEPDSGEVGGPEIAAREGASPVPEASQLEDDGPRVEAKAAAGPDPRAETPSQEEEPADEIGEAEVVAEEEAHEEPVSEGPSEDTPETAEQVGERAEQTGERARQVDESPAPVGERAQVGERAEQVGEPPEQTGKRAQVGAQHVGERAEQVGAEQVGAPHVGERAQQIDESGEQVSEPAHQVDEPQPPVGESGEHDEPTMAAEAPTLEPDRPTEAAEAPTLEPEPPTEAAEPPSLSRLPRASTWANGTATGRPATAGAGLSEELRQQVRARLEAQAARLAAATPTRKTPRSRKPRPGSKQTLGLDMEQERARLERELRSDIERLSKQDFYARLSVLKNADSEEIEQAYDRLSRRLHPDRVTSGLGSPELRLLAERRSLLLRRAYEGLISEESRRRYNAKLGLERAPEDAATMVADDAFVEGQRAASLEDWSRAQRSFSEAAKRDPEEGAYVAHLAWATFATAPEDPAALEQALELLRRAAELNPRQEEVYVFAGRIQRRQGRNEAALQAFQRALRCNPDCVEALGAIRELQPAPARRGGLLSRLSPR